MKKTQSCLKRVLIGCGSLAVLFVVLGAVIALTLNLNKPDAPAIATLDQSESLAEYMPLAVNGSQKPEKAVKLVLDISAAEIEMNGTSTNGDIQVSGDYDQANYELVTKIEEQDDQILYKLTFKSKRLLLATLINSGDHNTGPSNNKLKINLPPNLLYDIQAKTTIGNFDVDLGGLAVRSLDWETSKGETVLAMSQPNQVAMEHYKFKASMGDHQVRDIQNYRFKKGRFESRYGEMRISNSGDFQDDEVDISMEVSFGQARLELPVNTDLDNNSTVMMGGARVAHNDELSENQKRTKVRLTGGSTLGEHTIRFVTRKPEMVREIKRMMSNGTDLAECLRAAREQFDQGGEYDFSASSFNSFGYEYLWKKRIQESIAIFKFNVEIHPDYANGYDSLGEAFLAAGEKDLAIENYEKSLELNPHNGNGKRMLRRIRGQSEDGQQGEDTSKESASDGEG